VGANARHWLPNLQNEWEVKLGRYFSLYNGRQNMFSRQAYWRRRDVDTMLREHDYRPGYRAMPSARDLARPEVDVMERLLEKPLLRALCPYLPPLHHSTDIAEGFRNIDFFPTKTNKNKPRSDLRDAK
jgi:hypothetical protein